MIEVLASLLLRHKAQARASAIRPPCGGGAGYEFFDSTTKLEGKLVGEVPQMLSEQ